MSRIMEERKHGECAAYGLMFWAVFVIMGMSAPSSFATVNTGVFSPRGIGGGGGMYVLSISPYDEGLMFLVTDMGGAYRSEDGGERWELIHYTQGFRFMQFSTPRCSSRIASIGGRGRPHCGSARTRDARGPRWTACPGGKKRFCT